MKSLTVNFCVKNPKSYVKYNTSSMTLDDNINFPIEIYVKEVMNLSKSKKKSYKKIAKTFLMTVMSFQIFTSRSMASTLTITPSQDSVGLLLPPDFLHLCLSIIVTLTALAIVVAVVCMIAAGVARMFNLKSFSVDWIANIIQGLTNALMALPVVLFIYFLVVSILKILPIFSGISLGI